MASQTEGGRLPVTSYNVASWGNPVGAGAMGSFYITVSGIAKAAIPSEPFAVANEVICGELARVLRLPIPPGFIVTDPKGKPHHTSLNFNLSGQNLPPANCPAILSQKPWEAAGTIIFDIWVANSDRHNGNLAFDNRTNEMMLFDHSHAFMRGVQGQQRLANVTNSLGINQPTKHCLGSIIQSTDHFFEWSERVRQIPEFCIRGAVEYAAQVGLPNADVQFCVDFLMNRQNKLMPLVHNSRGEFPNVQYWP
ncbi:MAG: HipA family kinase [Tepidisphaeraceae bacterium]